MIVFVENDNFVLENEGEITILSLHLTGKWMEVLNGLNEDNFKYQVLFFY